MPPTCPNCHTPLPESQFIDRAKGGRNRWQRMPSEERRAFIAKLNQARADKRQATPAPKP